MAPNTVSTRFMSKSPTKPQFTPPTTVRTKATIFTSFVEFIKITSSIKGMRTT
ncbi:MAG: hypothetical protein NUV69_02910 [Candidatus Curtissbacteria bacterium]|nr:hypothetical protein [Candidatus Curtissbacteria bacterium]